DIGKYSREFQDRLRGAAIQVDHSTAGAQEAKRLYRNHPAGYILAYVIAGHHSGLPDFGSPADESSLAARLKKAVPSFEAYKEEVDTSFADEPFGKLPLRPNPRSPAFSIQFF